MSSSATSPEPEVPLGEPRGQQGTAHTVILLPTVSLMLVIIFGLFILFLKERRKNRQKIILLSKNLKKVEKKIREISKDHVVTTETRVTEENYEIVGDFEMDLIKHKNNFVNNPYELVRMSLPTLISLALCPVTLYLYPPLASWFWPVANFPEIPNINSGIACYLFPAGLVYATSFGYSYQTAMNKLASIHENITLELSHIDQILTMSTKLSLCDKNVVLDIIHATKAELMFMILVITGAEPEDFPNKPPYDVKVQLWSIMDKLKLIKSANDDPFGETVNQILADNIIKYMSRLNSICSDRMVIFQKRIHPIQWAFLEMLGFSSYFGVLLVVTGSKALAMVMCVLTVFSISLLCYIVSDLDSPFSGFFRVELDIIDDIIQRMHAIHHLAQRDCLEKHWSIK